MRAFPSVRRWQIRMIAVAMMLFLALALPAMIPGAGAASSVEWDTYNVAIDVRSDGSLHVVEEQWVDFGGAFSTGFADIPLNRIEELNNLAVYVGESPETADQAQFLPPQQYDAEPGTFTYRANSSTLNLDYAFERTSAGETRYIRLEYDAFGALRVYPDLEPPNQQLWWIAIASNVTEVAPVNDSTVTVTLPEEVPQDQVIAAPEDVEVDGATYTWHKSSLTSGEDFEVRLQFPMITAATEPSWQDRDDQIRQEQQEQEEKSAVAGTLFFAAGLIVFVLGGLGFSLAWFVRGRDPHVGAIADYIAHPPDDLSPGAVGTLVDEHVEVKDVLATVLDLARRKVIRINEAGKDEGVFGIGTGYTHEFEMLDPDKPVKDFEDTLLTSMFGMSRSAGQKVSMTGFRQNYTTKADAIAEGFYDELVDHGYFLASPKATRDRWGVIAVIFVLAVAGIALLVQNATDYSSGWVAFPIIGAILIGLYGWMIATKMPAKTREGAEASAKWKAFRRYLDDIDEREDLTEAEDIFEKYLPYAVAFGLEHSFVQKFSAAHAPMPEWFGGGGWSTGSPRTRPMRRRRRIGTGMPWIIGYPGGASAEGAGGSSGSGGGLGGVPDLQEMSDFGGQSLQGGSDSFFDMLNTASRAFSSGSRSGSFGSSSFGGFSGGGGFGGGGGGGGRGFG